MANKLSAAAVSARADRAHRALQLVARALRGRDHEILTLSYRFPKQWDRPGAGECDLVSWRRDGAELWLVEVKFRANADWAAPLLSERQRLRLRRACARLPQSLAAAGALAGRRVQGCRFFLAWVKSLDPPVIEFLENP